MAWASSPRLRTTAFEDVFALGESTLIVDSTSLPDWGGRWRLDGDCTRVVAVPSRVASARRGRRDQGRGTKETTVQPPQFVSPFLLGHHYTEASRGLARKAPPQPRRKKNAAWMKSGKKGERDKENTKKQPLVKIPPFAQKAKFPRTSAPLLVLGFDPNFCGRAAARCLSRSLLNKLSCSVHE